MAFNDELFMSSVDRVAELCNMFLEHDLNIKWNCNGSLAYADPDVLRLMQRSGCVFINYGVEAFDNDVLRTMKKPFNIDTITKGVEATLSAGISPGLNMLFGHIGDNVETLEKAVQFLLKYDDGAQLRTLRPVTPYPGSPLYYYAIEQGLLKDVAEFYEEKHINSDLLAVNFTELSDDEFYALLKEANKRLVSNFYRNREKSAIKNKENLYDNLDGSFRGFRHSGSQFAAE